MKKGLYIKAKLLTLGTVTVLLCAAFMASTAAASPKGIDFDLPFKDV
jgi:hypothetical protein